MGKLKKIKRKKNRKFRRIFRIFTRFFIFFTIIFLILFAIRHSSLFKVKDINISGIEKVKREEVLRKAKLRPADKFYNISKKDRINSIKSIPYVKDVKMTFNLGGKVNINIVERKPYYQIQKKDYNLIDSDFRIIDTTKDKNSNLMDIYGLDIENLKVGDYILRDKDSQEKVMLLEKLRDSKFNLEGNIKSVSLLDSISTFVTVDGIKVEFGSYNNIDYKLNMLKLILEDIKNTGKNVSLIEMEKSENPIVVEKDTKEEDIFDNNNTSKDTSVVINNDVKQKVINNKN